MAAHVGVAFTMERGRPMEIGAQSSFKMVYRHFDFEHIRDS